MAVTTFVPAPARLPALVLALGMTALVGADQTPQALPWAVDWTDTTLIATNDDWSAAPGIVGYRGDDLTTATGADPQLILADGTGTPIDVNVNLTNPDQANAPGGVGEFHLANPVVALNGSGTADAPFLLLSFTTAGQSSVQVSYALRDLDASIDNAVMPIALHYRIGTTGSFTNVPAAFVADATAPSAATLVTPVSVTLPADVENQAVVQIRIMTTNAVGSDEWVGIDDIAITAGAGSNPTVTPSATPNPVTIGDPLLVTGIVTPGGGPPGTIHTVQMDLSSVGGAVAQPLFDDGVDPDVAANDNIFSYRLPSVASPVGARSLTATVIDELERTSSRTFEVQVVAPVVVRLPHEIQGSGVASPFVGQPVVVDGVVTARKSNGFFVQTPPGLEDGDALSSDGVFVFTSSAPAATAAVGALVRVSGNVAEFAGDAFGPTLTEITGPGVTVLGSSPLPAPAALGSADLTPGGGLLQWEPYEGMRVTLAPLRAVTPTAGFVDENDAVGGTNGVFYAVFADRPRPFREPGIPTPDPVPPCAMGPCAIPVFDANPERIRIDSDGQPGAPALDLATGATISGVQGVVDYAFRTWTVLPDPPPLGPALTASGGMQPTGATPPAPGQFTVASFNMQRFYDTANDPDTSDVALTAVAFERRLAKASAVIRVALSLPDIVAVQEMENLATLQTLAARVNADAQVNGQGAPGYSAILMEGNDVGGIDVGFLVKARVTVHETIQWGKDTQYTNPLTGQPETLNDRPSLSIRATVGGQPLGHLPAPMIVVVNHLRSLNGIDDPVDGPRVRAKRQAQAEFLAAVLDELQRTTPSTPIAVVGDFNAFQFNDGYVDIIGTVLGIPAPPSDVSNASPDLVDPDFIDASLSLPIEQRYSYSFDGSAQTLDHVLLSQSAVPVFAGLVHPRISADFPEVLRNGTGPERLSDHDPVVAYFSFRTDNVRPTISSIAPSQYILWPASGALVPVRITIAATDNSGAPVCGVESVQSSEPVTGPPLFGTTSPDWVIDGPLDLRLRAERSPFGLGRVYAVKGTCTDAAGNKASAHTLVFVPRFWFQ